MRVQLVGSLFLGFSMPAMLLATYAKDDRSKHIHHVLSTFKATPNKLLTDSYFYIDSINRNRCRSSLENLKIACLKEAAGLFCNSRGKEIEKDACLSFMDMIIVNKLNEKNFIAKRERYNMMKKYKEVHRQVMRELNYRYAALTTEYLLTTFDCDSRDLQCLAKGIDSYCISYSDTNDLSWQGCVGALVWFIGTAKDEQP